MQCPNCNVAVSPGDRFCEDCGTALLGSLPTVGGCEKCGMPLAQIDAEGYCSNCGFRNTVAADDRLEITLHPHLAGVSDRGLRHHQNEDYLALQAIVETNTAILVVCDGVSSSQSPEQAAKIAAEQICLELATAMQTHQRRAEELLKVAVASALAAVCTIPYVKNADDDPPSTTLVAAIAQNRTVTIAWLGDSRAYWIAAEGSQPLTQDDSWLSEVVASGKLTEAEARQSPHAHAITRWLGADATDHAEPSLTHFTVPGAGYLLLCTDGLWNYAPTTQQMVQLVQQLPATDAAELCRNLVEFARSQGGQDNITVAVLSFPQESGSNSLFP